MYMTCWSVNTDARFSCLRAQEEYEFAVGKLDTEMMLLDERMRQHADVLCQASDAADTDKQHFVERIDRVRHRV